MSEPSLAEHAMLEWRHRGPLSLEELRALRAQAIDVFDDVIVDVPLGDVDGLLAKLSERSGKTIERPRPFVRRAAA